ncbi:hypothetical protein L1049_017244 [Liquidambar formosana]|uniref:RING-type domain-containing protein n=1 Tax=Liquidambar formosana TaxID=63359 RepID=A0AAP0S0V3_LIQFO
MTSQVVKVRREKLAACMTCPVCKKLLNDATTISECLHTFCRKCIYEKITVEELDSCPVCNTNLGCAPLERLRVDHSMQDLRAKIFPSKGKEAKAPEVVSSIPLPARRKERSLSSLVVDTPKVLAQTGLTGRRTKSAARKVPAPRESLSIEEPIKKVEDHPETLSPPETLNKIAQNRRQNSSTAELFEQHMPNKGKEEIYEPVERKAELWKPLNCLVEAASKTKPGKSNSQGSVAKSASSHDHDNEAPVPRAKAKERDHKSKVCDVEDSSTPVSSGSVKPRKLLREGGAPLPQIPSCYLRIKDGNVPVSFIKKYIVKKLNLTSEAEVEITLRGQPVVPTLQLHDLVDLWLQTLPPSDRIQSTVGSSARNYMMELSYGRKAQPV